MTDLEGEERPAVEIAGEGAQLRIEVVSHSDVATIDPDDAEWIRCDVELKVGGLRALIGANFVRDDFANLGDELAAALETVSGTASFETYEDALAFEVAFQPNGGAQVSGRAVGSERPRAVVSFDFETDQSYLRQSLVQLRRITRAFPPGPSD